MDKLIAEANMDRFTETWLEGIDLVSLLSMLAIVFAVTCWVYL